VLQQDAYAVDIRCIKLRDDLVPVFGEVTGRKLSSTFEDLSQEEIASLSLRLAGEVRKRGYRIMWDPEIVHRI
jgi:hypothetical protein